MRVKRVVRLMPLVLVFVAACSAERIVNGSGMLAPKDPPLLRAKMSATELRSRLQHAIGNRNATRSSKLFSADPVDEESSNLAQYNSGWCDLGAVACGVSEAALDAGGFSAYSATYSPDTDQMPMLLVGKGSFRRGTGILGSYFLIIMDCWTAYDDVCPDGDYFNDTCEEEENVMKFASYHAVSWNFRKYDGYTDADHFCRPNSSSGGVDEGDTNGANGNCEIVSIDIDQWNASTNSWDYHHTEHVQVCD